MGTAAHTTKALPGSAEEALRKRTDAIAEAIRASGLISGGFYITDTFDDYVVVYRWSSDDYASALFKIEYSLDGDAVKVGAMSEVKKVYVEELVEPGAAGAPALKAAGPDRRKMARGFRIKSLEEAEDDVGGWTGSGVFSVFGKVDHSNDVVHKGATAKSIAARLPKIKDHHGVTVGQATKAAESNEGLEVDFRIYPTTAGTDLAILMKQIDTDQGPAAPVEEGSIGFSPTAGGFKKNAHGGYDFTEITVWEVSPVTFGDNPHTRVGLKSAEALEELPTDQLLGYAGDTLRSAVEGPSGIKALHRRRALDDRDLKTEQWKALDALLVDALEVGRELLTLKAAAGRWDAKANGAQLRHTRAIIESLTELVHGRRGEPQPVADPVDETVPDEEPADDGGKPEGKPRGASARRGKSAEAGTDDATPGAEALHDLEFDVARSAFERMAGLHVTEA